MTTDERFYEINDPAAHEMARDCRAQWDLAEDAEIGPVNTNYPAHSSRSIDLVVVCESPSFEEIRNSNPAWADTGRKILNRWRNSRGESSLKKSQFEYQQLARNGIYVTNLVRCQADWISEDCYNNDERLLTSAKDRRVKQAWPLNAFFIADELQKIADQHRNASVLFACGSAFEDEVKLATNFAESAGLKWLVSFHPSRLAKRLSWHYNPQQWRDKQGTFPDARQEINRRNQNQNEPEEDDPVE